MLTSGCASVSACDWDWGIGTGTLAEGGGWSSVSVWVWVEASDRAERVKIDGGEPCSDANERAGCSRPARARAFASASCEEADEADDDAVRMRDAGGTLDATPFLGDEEDDDTERDETGEMSGERPVTLSSVRARTPARRGSTVPAPPTTGMPNV